MEFFLYTIDNISYISNINKSNKVKASNDARCKDFFDNKILKTVNNINNRMDVFRIKRIIYAQFE